MKKKILIGVAVFFGIVIIAAASVTVWQWRNIKALYVAVTTDEEVIDEKLRESDVKFADDVKGYLQDSVRDFTEEELQQIESGEKSKTEILAKIISESIDADSAAAETENRNDADTVLNGQNVSSVGSTGQNISGSGSTGQNVSGSGSTGQNISGSGSTGQNISGAGSTGQNVSGSGSSNTQSQQSAQTSKTAEQIVAAHVANLYAYQSEFESRVSALSGTVTSYVHSYKASNPSITWHDAKVAAVQKYMSSATAIESECYSKVDSEVAKLKADLKAIGADTSIADTVAASAENQIELKKSKLMSQYMSKMN